MNKNNNFFKSGLFYVIVFLAFIGIAYWLVDDTGQAVTESVTTTEFITYLEEDRVESFDIQPNGMTYEIVGSFRDGEEIEAEEDQGFSIIGSPDQETDTFRTTMISNDPIVEDVYDLARENDIDMQSLEEPSTGIWASLLVTFLPLLLFIGLLYLMMGQSQGGGGGRGVMNFGKSKAKQQDPKKSKVRFSDVAGADEEKAELVEIVEFLKDPRKFSSVGARIPAGVLLEGPPGTGKTLLAKAVAGEAGVPFFSISGSEFVEMFVGVGASRVRDLFENAKKNAPSIIFIDEIDAVGRQRGAGMGGGHDEREQTLNQLLTEMDGFEGNEGVIVMAATNRQDVLDPALLRPGRFDRRILVGRPDVKGREAILKVHARNKPIASEVDLGQIARQTPGFSGADLENLLNEAALIAARRNSKEIGVLDMDEAHDRVIAGPAKKDKAISDKQRTTVAYHEAGHTIIGMVLSDARTVHKVTIVPRGRAGGYAIMLPKEDQFIVTYKELYDQVVGLLGGRAAEEIVFNHQSTGASNDFEQATQIVRAMITQYGMSKKLGTVQYEGDGQPFAGRQYGQSANYSERTAYEIDQEVQRIMDEAMAQAHEIINDHRDQLNTIAEKLLEVETLDAVEIKSLFETGQMPSAEEREKYPSERQDISNEDDPNRDEDQVGTSFEEIKDRQEAYEEEREETLEARTAEEETDESDDQPDEQNTPRDSADAIRVEPKPTESDDAEESERKNKYPSENDDTEK